MTERKKSNVDDMVVKDEDGKVLIFDGCSSWAYFRKYFFETVAANGYSIYVGNDPIDVPDRPDQAIDRRNNVPGAGPPHPDDNRTISDWKKEQKTWESGCSIVLALFKRSITKIVRDYLVGVPLNMTLATRDNIFELINGTQQRFGVYTPEKSQINFNLMVAIPKFRSVMDVITGMRKINDLYEERVAWGNVAEIWTDEQRKSFLLFKIREWPTMFFILGQIDADPLMPYADCVTLMMTKVTQLQNVDLLATKQAMELAVKVNPYTQSSSLEHSMFGGAINVPQGSYPSRYIPYSTVRGCFNCQGMDHYAINCPVLWCYICGSDWTATPAATNIHHNSVCPHRVQGFAQKRNSQQAGLLQQGPSRSISASMGRGQYSASTRGRGGAASRTLTSTRSRGGIIPSVRGRGSWPPRGTGRTPPLAAIAEI